MKLLKRLGIVLAILVGAIAVLSYPAYLGAKWAFERYFDNWGKKLVELDKRGLLSREFGAAWQDILTNEAMLEQAQRITDTGPTGGSDSIAIVDGVPVDDYPSLTLVARLNEVHEYSNTIEIVDRKHRPIALIRTDHTRGQLDEFPETLITALIAAEDEGFWENRLGFEFRSYVRAMFDAVKRSALCFSISKPRGTSTITQQVAKLFISHLDEQGRRYVSRSIDRKLREMRIAAALRRVYTPEQILEVYLNHCVTSDHGLIGYKDISLNLFNKRPMELSDPEAIYLARMVKWGRNLKPKIIQQCAIDMPRMGAALGWDEAKQDSVLAQLDSLKFARPKRIITEQGQLVDCANEFWLRVLEKRGATPKQLGEFDLLAPNSLIRKKGNLVLRLTIDLPLQRTLEKLVDGRGYGPDTVVTTDVRIGSMGEDVKLTSIPRDTLRHVEVLDTTREFSEPDESYVTLLEPGDTLITNIRYKKKDEAEYRRSLFYYTRRDVKVGGQYFAYAIMDSKSGKLLAYYSRDRIGSKLSGLLRYRTPNGSSTAKPIFNALNFDLGIFEPYDMWTDTVNVREPVPWRRRLEYYRGRRIGVIYEQSAVRGRGYHVQNHDRIFEGCNYIYDLLATSNNIFGVESCYRIDRRLFDAGGDVLPSAVPLYQYFYRLGVLPRIKRQFRSRPVTGVRAYKEFVRIVGADVDSVSTGSGTRPVSDSLYSVALGTLELTLLEQMHIYNVLYDNDLIERPASHPSLFVESITLNGKAVPVVDTIKHYHPFADINNIRPTYLGMHKRLISNRWDRLQPFDIAYPFDSAQVRDTVFDPMRFLLAEPPSNYAKSGTTDDIIRPFYAPPESKERTNYGLWNAVLRLDLTTLAGKKGEPEVRDVTIACIGECVRRYTGPRDGKSLHGFLTRALLKKAGTVNPDGFYTRYEQYLRRTTPPSVRNCGAAPLPTESAEGPPTPDSSAETSNASASASVVE